MGNEHDSVPEHPAVLTRRSALQRLGAAGIGVASLGGVGSLALGCGGEGSSAAYAASCRLTPESTEGPFYLDLRKLRSTISEGKAGLRLDLRIRVVNAETCKPIEDVAVDLWHTDAAGRYSGIASEGTTGKTFMRGIQLTDATGLARLRTIYPGWYDGRATHIHVMAHVGGRVGAATYSGAAAAHTGQLFFSDAATDKVARLAPYSSRAVARVRNDADGIYRQGGSGQVLELTRRGSSLRAGLTGAITIGVDA